MPTLFGPTLLLFALLFGLLNFPSVQGPPGSEKEKGSDIPAVNVDKHEHHQGHHQNPPPHSKPEHKDLLPLLHHSSGTSSDSGNELNSSSVHGCKNVSNRWSPPLPPLRKAAALPKDKADRLHSQPLLHPPQYALPPLTRRSSGFLDSTVHRAQTVWKWLDVPNLVGKSPSRSPSPPAAAEKAHTDGELSDPENADEAMGKEGGGSQLKRSASLNSVTTTWKSQKDNFM